MSNFNFPGGNTQTTYDANFTTTDWYVEQTGVSFPDGNLSLEGDYPILIDGINPKNLSGSSRTRLRFGGNDYKTGDIISTDGVNGKCSIRIYKNGSTTVVFNRTNNSNTPAVKLYNSSGTLQYTWYGQMTGNWDYTIVPLPPSLISAALSGTDVVVTRGTSTIADGYKIQYQSSTDGVTYGAWSTAIDSPTTPTTISGLEKGKFYKFRVYGTNTAGNGAATTTTSSTFVPGFGYRYTSTTEKTPVLSAKVFVGIGQPDADASGWKLVSNVKRYVADAGNGSPGWINLQS